MVYLTKLFRPNCPQTVIDEVLLLFFAGPKSLTGENVVEIHCHGGLAVVDEILECLNKLPTFRLAQAGEFTKRALLNGKVSISQANAVNQLVNANTSKQKLFALSSYLAELPKQKSDGTRKAGEESVFGKWRHALVECQASIEACLDFGEEEHIDSNAVCVQLADSIDRVVEEMKSVLHSAERRSRVHDGIRVVLVGAPNVGKSSLMNLLSRRRVSIVSDERGTTRDVIETIVDIGGWPVVLSDTAGLTHSPNHHIEKEGIEMALDKIQQADILLHVQSVETSTGEENEQIRRALTYQQQTIRSSSGIPIPIITVINKADLLNSTNSNYSDRLVAQFEETEFTDVSGNTNTLLKPSGKIANAERVSYQIADSAEHTSSQILTDDLVANDEDLSFSFSNWAQNFKTNKKTTKLEEVSTNCQESSLLVSCLTKQGIKQLESLLVKILDESFSEQDDLFSLQCLSYQSQVLKECISVLTINMDTNDNGCSSEDLVAEQDLVMLSERVRYAVDKLSSLIGQPVLTDRILDSVFSNFCIGK
ncbi:tRNA modification GTPase MnmE-like isoform X2 [Symsagittifera roscoffensis]|uniref:tRNA modification GTPase MnmE-like isoform X2 n=1 Tax=Symsagittifera roscoffensis TaxID=84072 RepID=UPI00307C5A90